MIRVDWIAGESKGYSDLLPDMILTPGVNEILVHEVAGPRGGRYLAKCRVVNCGSYAELDYAAFPEFNNRTDMALGIMRIPEALAASGDVLWCDARGSRLIGGEAKAIFHPGMSLAEYEISSLRARAGGDTRAPQLIDARRGQGRFRSDLERLYMAQCALTGISLSSLLRASHIKPWAICTDDERLDPENGLLLAAHVDALFDRFLVTFAPDGELLWQKAVSNVDRMRLNLPTHLPRQLTPKQQMYLGEHRRAFGISSASA